MPISLLKLIELSNKYIDFSDLGKLKTPEPEKKYSNAKIIATLENEASGDIVTILDNGILLLNGKERENLKKKGIDINKTIRTLKQHGFKQFKLKEETTNASKPASMSTMMQTPKGKKTTIQQNHVAGKLKQGYKKLGYKTDFTSNPTTKSKKNTGTVKATKPEKQISTIGVHPTQMKKKTEELLLSDILKEMYTTPKNTPILPSQTKIYFDVPEKQDQVRRLFHYMFINKEFF